MIFILGVHNARFHPNFSLLVFGFIYKSLSYRTKSGIPQGFHKELSAGGPSLCNAVSHGTCLYV